MLLQEYGGLEFLGVRFVPVHVLNACRLRVHQIIQRMVAKLAARQASHDEMPRHLPVTRWLVGFRNTRAASQPFLGSSSPLAQLDSMFFHVSAMGSGVAIGS